MKATKEPITLNELKEGVHVVRNNTLSKSNPDGTFSIVLHETVIADLFFNGTIKLYSGGHKTETTKRRLNSILKGQNKVSYIFKVEGEWYIKLPTSKIIPFVEGMLIDQ